MRITILFVAGLFSVSSPAFAEDYTKEELAPWLKCMVENSYGHPYNGQCNNLYPTRKLAESAPSYRDSPEYKDYELRAFKADIQTAREIEAINRNYRLRRSGVLPW